MRRPWRSFLLFIVVGMLGVAVAMPMIIDMMTTTLEGQGLGDEVLMSPVMLAALSMINPLILVTLATIVGHLCAHAAGFTSLLYIRDRFQAPMTHRWLPALRAGVIAGVIVGVILLIGDRLFQPFVPPEMYLLNQPFGWYTLVVSLVYGGIVEEIIMRWGLMTFLVWVVWKIANRKANRPSCWIVWIGIVGTALLFGFAHYGVTAAATDMTAPVLMRMLVLNGVGGIVFGWLYWKANLEAAMFAHMFAHVTLYAAYLLAALSG